MLTDIVVRVRCIVSIFGIIVACLACVACGTERQDAVPSPSQTTAKAEDGTEFTGAYARRFADTYDNLQTGFARNLIKDGKISEKDIAALESKVMDCICAQAQSEDDFPTFDLTDGALTPVPHTGRTRRRTTGSQRNAWNATTGISSVTCRSMCTGMSTQMTPICRTDTPASVVGVCRN